MAALSAPVITQSTRRARLRIVGKRHPPPSRYDAVTATSALVTSIRIVRNQRGGVPVVTQAEMDQVEHGRRSGDVVESLRIAHGCGIDVGSLHGHRVDLGVAGLGLCGQTRA